MTLQVRYAFDDSNLVEKTAKSRGQYLRVHFKNTRETAAAVNGLKLSKAYAYLGNVVEKKQCIPFRRFNGGVGRTQQAKEFKTTQGKFLTQSKEHDIGRTRDGKHPCIARWKENSNQHRSEISDERIICRAGRTHQQQKLQSRQKHGGLSIRWRQVL